MGITALAGAASGMRDSHVGVSGDVAASLFGGLRRLLVEDGRWARVRDRVVEREANAAEWIDATVPSDWVSIHHHLAVLQGLEDLSGVASLRAVGRARSHAVSMSGALAPILRGWIRNYAATPEQFIRVTPHVWAAATRGLGRLVLLAPDPTKPNKMSYQSERLPHVVFEAKPWHTLLEGFGEGLIELAGRDGTATITQLPDLGEIDISFRWT